MTTPLDKDEIVGNLKEEGRRRRSRRSRRSDGSTSESPDSQTSGPPDSQTSGHPERETSRHSDFQEKLKLMVGELRKEGHSFNVQRTYYLSDECASALKTMMAVLENRYRGEVTMSMIVDYAVRQVVREALREGEESDLIRWLDQRN